MNKRRPFFQTTFTLNVRFLSLPDNEWQLLWDLFDSEGQKRYNSRVRFASSEDRIQYVT